MRMRWPVSHLCQPVSQPATSYYRISVCAISLRIASHLGECASRYQCMCECVCVRSFRQLQKCVYLINKQRAKQSTANEHESHEIQYTTVKTAIHISQPGLERTHTYCIHLQSSASRKTHALHTTSDRPSIHPSIPK